MTIHWRGLLSISNSISSSSWAPEQGSTGGMPHRDDAEVRVVSVCRKGNNAYPRIFANLDLDTVADFDGIFGVLWPVSDRTADAGVKTTSGVAASWSNPTVSGGAVVRNSVQTGRRFAGAHRFDPQRAKGANEIIEAAIGIKPET